MIRQNKGRRSGKFTIQRALKSIDRTADQLLRSNDECLIPESEAIGHDRMNNCHVIAEPRLELIANERGEVLCWPTSTRSIGRAAQRAISQGHFETNPLAIAIERYEPVPRSKNHKDCKFTFACHNHDDRVFKLIDSVDLFNSEDKESLFKLGLRTTAAYTAWYRGHKKWSQHDFKEDSYLRRVLREYPSLQTACDAISEWGTQESSAGRNLEKEMVRWQTSYQESAWHRATSEIREIKPLLRIAATGIPGPQDCPVAMTMLPTANGECLLVVTILEGETRIPWLTKRRRRTAARQVADQWEKSLTELKPAEWLPRLALQCEFLYVSPHDYYNDEIVTCEERCEIEQAIAKKAPTYRI